MITNARSLDLAVRETRGQPDSFEGYLSALHEASPADVIDVRFHMVSPFITAMPCSENITRAMVVGSDGSVSPCVMKNLPVAGKNYYYFNHQKRLHENLKFGDIHLDPLNHIWHQKTYRQFIRHANRRSVPTLCKDCYKRYIDRLEPDNSWIM